jgi:hypothetical protein
VDVVATICIAVIVILFIGIIIYALFEQFLWSPINGCGWLLVILIIGLVIYFGVRLFFPDFIPTVIEPFVSNLIRIVAVAAIPLAIGATGYYLYRRRQQGRKYDSTFQKKASKSKKKRGIDQVDELVANAAVGDDGELLYHNIEYKFSGTELRRVTDALYLERGMYRVNYEYSDFEKMQLKVIRISDGVTISSLSELVGKGSATFYCEEANKYVVEIVVSSKYTRWKLKISYLW